MFKIEMKIADQLKQLKQTNMSVDSEKTKQRFKKIWKGATPGAKQLIEETANVSLNTIYRINKLGNISPKLSIIMGAVLHISPFYLAGIVDEPGVCSDDIITKIINDYRRGAPASAKKKEAEKKENIPDKMKVRLIKKNQIPKKEDPVITDTATTKNTYPE